MAARKRKTRKKPMTQEDRLLGDELESYAVNTWNVYRGYPDIARVLARRKLRGEYKAELADKAWFHFANNAAKAHNREFGGPRSGYGMFTPNSRRYAAQELRKFFDEHVNEMCRKLKSGVPYSKLIDRDYFR